MRYAFLGGFHSPHQGADGPRKIFLRFIARDGEPIDDLVHRPSLYHAQQKDLAHHRWHGGKPIGDPVVSLLSANGVTIGGTARYREYQRLSEIWKRLAYPRDHLRKYIQHLASPISEQQEGILLSSNRAGAGQPGWNETPEG
jgi:hypothetical protein